MTDDLIKRAREALEGEPMLDPRARYLIPAMADRIEALEAEVALLREARPGFTADDLRRAWEAAIESVAALVQTIVKDARVEAKKADFSEGETRLFDVTLHILTITVEAIRALTPPADLADKVKEGEG